MVQIKYIDRVTKKEERERVYGGWALGFLYEKKWGAFFRPIIARIALFSLFYGFLQKLPFTKKKIKPFIKKFDVDASEFEKSVNEFTSFNDFFIRKLKPSSRLIAKNEAIIFADGRYLFFPNVEEVKEFWVKGERFTLQKLLQDKKLASLFEGGSMVIARLCPSDYHRFHFPFDCTPSETKLINGYLYSVNPVALKKNIGFLCQNKRAVTLLESSEFGTAAYVEIGATYVGSISQTYTPNTEYKKGDEKGYFSFGGSCIILLFQKGKIAFDEDLLAFAKQKIEVRALLGQSLGKPLYSF